MPPWFCMLLPCGKEILRPPGLTRKETQIKHGLLGSKSRVLHKLAHN